MGSKELEDYISDHILSHEDIPSLIKKEYIELGFDEKTEESIADNDIKSVNQNIEYIEAIIEKVVCKHIDLNLLGFDTHIKKLSELDAEDVGKLVKIRGMINGFTSIKPMFLKAVFVCKICKNVRIIEQNEPFKLDSPIHCGAKTSSGKTCICTKFDLDLEHSKFQDSQKLIMQELPDDIRQIPIAKDILVLKKSLLNKVKCGDRVEIIGIVRVKVKDKGDTRFTDIYIEPNNIIVTRKDIDSILLTTDTINKIKEASEDPNIYYTLIANLAPSLVLVDDEKEAMLLAMVGGVESTSIDAKRRDWIHILLAGDPSTAKSQLLRTVAELSPIGMYVGGRGISRAGLTAAVIKEDDSWMLIAGAMPLCDKGICCIDELDKMNPEDREGMHIAMEQGTCPINKANINATLSAKASVIAAANPILSKYDTSKSISENIKNLPLTLQSRFDLIFIMLDKINAERDRVIAERIMGESEEITAIWEDRELFKSYLIYAKSMKPKMTPEAQRAIKEFYLNIRAKSSKKENMPVTPRQLEALKRLSEAHAKLLLKETVDVEDAEAVIRLMKVSIDETCNFCSSNKSDSIKSDKEKRIFDILKEKRKISKSKLKEMCGWDDEEFERILIKVISRNKIIERRKGAFEVDYEIIGEG
jgi:replicative DNA helicase Mcm